VTSPKEEKASLRDFSSTDHDNPPTNSLLEEGDDNDNDGEEEEELKNRY
jgi:hypothetical protein